MTENFWGKPNGGDRMPQLDKLTAEEWATIDLVFVSIGGNDAGFGDVIKMLHRARLRRRHAARRSTAPVMGWWREQQLGNLPQVGADVGSRRASIRNAAPQAEVYQINYMDPFRPQPTPCPSLSLAVALSDFDRTRPGTSAAAAGRPGGRR